MAAHAASWWACANHASERAVPKLLSAIGPWFGLCGVLGLIALGWALVAALRGRALRSARLVYLASLGSAAVFYGAFMRGRHPRMDLISEGPISDLRVTLLCVAAAWLLIGLFLFVLGRRAWTVERAAFWLAFALLAGSYLNVVRERPMFGDVFDYLAAAQQIMKGEPLHARYLYPPLLATLLAPLAKYGETPMYLLLLGLNLLSVMALFVLLRRTLMRYGFADLAATLLSFAALCANVAVLRTLFYMQTNLHMTNLMLLCLLFYPASPFASALALGLAVHIKTSPLVLALPFALNRDLRWLAWFALVLGGIVALTSYANGFAHYREYYDNVSNIYRANGINFRENSLDSLVRGTLAAFRADVDRATRLLYVLRGLLFAFALWLCHAAVKARTFSAARGSSGVLAPREARVLDSYPILMLLLMTVSPLIWEHHPVLVVLPLLVMLKVIDREGDAVLWLLAWCLLFVVPTFDLYPFSYRISLGCALAYWLLFRLVRRRDVREGRWFGRVHAVLARLGPPDDHSDRSSAPPVSSR
jgi:hypothetical protein